MAPRIPSCGDHPAHGLEEEQCFQLSGGDNRFAILFPGLSLKGERSWVVYPMMNVRSFGPGAVHIFHPSYIPPSASTATSSTSPNDEFNAVKCPKFHWLKKLRCSPTFKTHLRNLKIWASCETLEWSRQMLTTSAIEPDHHIASPRRTPQWSWKNEPTGHVAT